MPAVACFSEYGREGAETTDTVSGARRRVLSKTYLPGHTGTGSPIQGHYAKSGINEKPSTASAAVAFAKFALPLARRAAAIKRLSQQLRFCFRASTRAIRNSNLFYEK